MPFQPTHRDVHINRPLSNLSIAYVQTERDFVLSKISRPLTVNKKSDLIPFYDKEYWFRDEAQLRAPATESVGSGYKVHTSPYLCQEYAFHKDFPDEVVDNADAPFRPDNEARMLVTVKLLLKRDILLADAIFKEDVWDGDKDSGDGDFVKWSDWAMSNPLMDVENARDAVHSVTAKNINRMLIGRGVWRYLKHHPQLLDRIKWTQRGMITHEIVSSLMEIERIVIGESIKGTGIEGGSSQTYGYIYGNHVLFLYITEQPTLMQPTAYISFMWRHTTGMPVRIRRLYNDWGQFTRIEGLFDIDNRIVATDCGYFMKDVV